MPRRREPAEAHFWYLESDGKPLVSSGMITPNIIAMHKSAMCLGVTGLTDAFLSHFAAGGYAGGEVKAVATRVAHACATCAGRMPMPKKQHDESVHTLRYGERFQIELQTSSRTCGGSHGYRYILTVVDCASKEGAMYPLKTLTMAECVGI